MNKNIIVVLAVMLILFSHSPSLSQSTDQKAQILFSIQVSAQRDSPLIIIPTENDFTHENLVTIKFSIQNNGYRSIKAFSVSRSLAGDENLRGLITFMSPLDVGNKIDGWVSEAKINLKKDSKVLLAIDYVLFDDGRSWGKNSRNESDFISGFPDGQKEAFSRIKKLATDSDEEALSKLFLLELSDVNTFPANRSKSESWQAGFIAGYKVVLSELKTIYQKHGIAVLPSKIDSFNELVGPIRISM